MTIDEAIKHAKKVAEVQEEAAKEWHENQVRKCELIPFAEMDYTHENNCKKCADEHRQLAEWLKELKAYKEQEPCGDAVSRQAVLDVDFKRIVLTTAKPAETIRQKIQELPPATPTQKKGKWEQYGDFWKEKYRCSECKEEQPKILCGEQIIGHWSDYCPNCGAKMAENEEDKELIVNKDVYDTLTEEQKKFVDIGLSYFNNRKRGIKNENRR